MSSRICGSLLALTRIALLAILAFLLFSTLFPLRASAETVIFLTSGSSWTVPNDWNNSANTIECIGGGGGGGRPSTSVSGGGGGGGGGYSKVTNQTYTPGAGRTIAIASAGTGATSNNTAGGTGGDTSIKQNDNSTDACLAKGGNGGAANGSTGTGGAAGSGVGETKQSGGNGGTGNVSFGIGGGAGGGAGGPNGDGKTGGNTATTASGAGGGGGANNGANGSSGVSSVGGPGGNGRGGSGGGSGGGGNATAGTGGGGGGGSGGASGGAGGTGAQDTIWTQTSDSATAGPSGGGGGGGGGSSVGGLGGGAAAGYGGGGGGGGGGPTFSGNGGDGRQGIIIITYTPVVPGTPAIIINNASSATGNVTVTGIIGKGSGSFVIDHPLDPKNKLLYHSFVESPDVKNLYDGLATLDENGEAVIQLPRYFMALNKDYRYLASAIEQPMPNLHLKRGVYQRRFLWLFPYGNPQFSIAGGVPGGQISWQATGIRHDPFILANPIIPVVQKSDTTIVKKGECLFQPLCN